MHIDDIQGWDTYWPLYEKWVKEAKNGCNWVEVGVFQGKGIIGGALEAMYCKKDIKFYAVDTWDGSDEQEHKTFIEKVGGADNFYQQFIQNIERYGVDHLICPIRKKSVDAAKDFADNSLDIVYLDASHDFHSVKNDINAWFPKVKQGGILAGHDIAFFDVKQAVLETLAEYHDEINDSWIFYVQ
jgi:hypothetical protein